MQHDTNADEEALQYNFKLSASVMLFEVTFTVIQHSTFTRARQPSATDVAAEPL